jgi:hypothetical protein
VTPTWVVSLNAFAVVATAAATLVLAIVTCVYAKHTSVMADATRASSATQERTLEEMRAARRASYRPLLVPHVEAPPNALGGALWGVRNVGTGPALDVDIALGWSRALVFALRRPVIAVGETRFVTNRERNEEPNLAFEPLRQGHPTLLLAGTYRDIEGTAHTANVTAPFRDEWNNNLHEALREMVEQQMREAGIDPNTGASA